jgi:uncharacterized protein (TIGR03086 family)
MTEVNDPRPLLQRSYEVAADVLAGVRDDQWSLPTPCTAYDTRTLAGHLVGASGRVSKILSGEGIEAPLEAPDLADTQAFAGHVKRAADEAASLLSDPSVLDRDYTLPWGTYSGRTIVEMYAIEMAAHSWDLAVSTGQDDLLDDGVAEALLPAAERIIPAEFRGGEMPFAAVVEVPADARPAEKLAGFTGRRRV